MMHHFAATELHVSMSPEPIFTIGSFQVLNSHTLWALALAIVLLVMFYGARQLKAKKYNRFVGLLQWMFEGLFNTATEVMGDRAVARRIFPVAFTIFILVLVGYWVSILPGIGPITVNGTPVFRAIVADLNFTFALAIITIVVTQIYAIRYHGFFGNIKRYLKNPFKDPIGAFEGILEIVGEFSRLLSLSFRLFGNAFAGEILLIVAAVLTSYAAVATLPIVMAFELFIGFIQAYVFFMLTLIFTSLGRVSHDSHEPTKTSLDHSPATLPLQAAKQK